MNARRLNPVVSILAVAWLSTACQSSPTQPSPTPPVVVPPAVDLFVSLSGTVSEAAADPDAEPTPLSGVTINVSVDDTGMASTVSSDDGRYAISRPKGAATITVTKEGYGSVTRSIDLTEDTEINFTLKRLE